MTKRTNDLKARVEELGGGTPACITARFEQAGLSAGDLHFRTDVPVRTDLDPDPPARPPHVDGDVWDEAVALWRFSYKHEWRNRDLSKCPTEVLDRARASDEEYERLAYRINVIAFGRRPSTPEDVDHAERVVDQAMLELHAGGVEIGPFEFWQWRSSVNALPAPEPPPPPVDRPYRPNASFVECDFCPSHRKREARACTRYQGLRMFSACYGHFGALTAAGNSYPRVPLDFVRPAAGRRGDAGGDSAEWRSTPQQQAQTRPPADRACQRELDLIEQDAQAEQAMTDRLKPRAPRVVNPERLITIPDSDLHETYIQRDAEGHAVGVACGDCAFQTDAYSELDGQSKAGEHRAGYLE